MRRYADVLSKKAAAKLALANTEEVMVGGEMVVDDKSEDEEPLSKIDLLPELQKKSVTKRKGNAAPENGMDVNEVGYNLVSLPPQPQSSPLILNLAQAK